MFYCLYNYKTLKKSAFLLKLYVVYMYLKPHRNGYKNEFYQISRTYKPPVPSVHTFHFPGSYGWSKVLLLPINHKNKIHKLIRLEIWPQYCFLPSFFIFWWFICLHAVSSVFHPYDVGSYDWKVKRSFIFQRHNSQKTTSMFMNWKRQNRDNGSPKETCRLHLFNILSLYTLFLIWVPILKTRWCIWLSQGRKRCEFSGFCMWQ